MHAHSFSHMEEPILATGPCRGSAVETRPGLQEGLTRGVIIIAVWHSINQPAPTVFMTHTVMMRRSDTAE